MAHPRSLTEVLSGWQTETAQTLEALLPKAYDELRRLAHRYLRKQRPEHSLQSTALVHEAYLRLAKQQDDLFFENEKQFFGLAALIMRQILVDCARNRAAVKRDGGYRITLVDSLSLQDGKNLELIALDDALNDLARLDPQQSRIVELRFFGGLSIEETAEVLEISPATVKRHWSTARAFLHHETVFWKWRVQQIHRCAAKLNPSSLLPTRPDPVSSNLPLCIIPFWPPALGSAIMNSFPSLVQEGWASFTAPGTYALAVMWRSRSCRLSFPLIPIGCGVSSRRREQRQS